MKQRQRFEPWRQLLFSALLLLAMGMTVTACSSDEENKEYITTLTEVKGEVNLHYDQWYIRVSPPNTYDAVYYYFPSNLSSEYKKEGLKVVFSGKVFETSITVNNVAGITCYGVYLTSITKN
ncbi:MAG: hypothetical protein IJ698_00865 [Prevotella sp.]|nr:hypothetical protein [Prevotella sp.]